MCKLYKNTRKTMQNEKLNLSWPKREPYVYKDLDTSQPKKNVYDFVARQLDSQAAIFQHWLRSPVTKFFPISLVAFLSRGHIPRSESNIHCYRVSINCSCRGLQIRTFTQKRAPKSASKIDSPFIRTHW